IVKVPSWSVASIGTNKPASSFRLKSPSQQAGRTKLPVVEVFLAQAGPGSDDAFARVTVTVYDRVVPSCASTVMNIGLFPVLKAMDPLGTPLAAGKPPICKVAYAS